MNNPDTGTTKPDAGPWTPSNFTVGSIANALTPTPPDVDVQGDCAANTDDGSWTCGNGQIGGNPDGGSVTPPFATVTLSGAGGGATVWAMSSFKVDTGMNLEIRGSKPAIIYVLGNVEINAPIVVTAGSHATGGPGAGTSPANSTSTGGGGGGYCGAGGKGAAVADAGAVTSAGGAANGSATLVPLFAGYPGGGDNGNANGGSGGGALQITALGPLAVTATGSILAAGIHGGNNNGVYAGGGGSGGAILLESPAVSIAGSLSVNGASGGDVNTTGNDGALGTNQAVPGGNGGQGGAGAVSTGGDGTGTTGASGGGGAGYIRINTSNPSLAGTFSPDLGDAGGGCTTVGPL